MTWLLIFPKRLKSDSILRQSCLWNNLSVLNTWMVFCYAWTVICFNSNQFWKCWFVQQVKKYFKRLFIINSDSTVNSKQKYIKFFLENSGLSWSTMQILQEILMKDVSLVPLQWWMVLEPNVIDYCQILVEDIGLNSIKGIPIDESRSTWIIPNSTYLQQ